MLKTVNCFIILFIILNWKAPYQKEQITKSQKNISQLTSIIFLKLMNKVQFHDISMYYVFIFPLFAFVVFCFFVTFKCKPVQFVYNYIVPNVPVIWCV